MGGGRAWNMRVWPGGWEERQGAGGGIKQGVWVLNYGENCEQAQHKADSMHGLWMDGDVGDRRSPVASGEGASGAVEHMVLNESVFNKWNKTGFWNPGSVPEPGFSAQKVRL